MQISKQVGLGQDSVSKWRCRFISFLPLLQEIAQKDPSNLEKAVSSFLNDCPMEFEYIRHGTTSLIGFLTSPQAEWKRHILTRHAREKIS